MKILTRYIIWELGQSFIFAYIAMNALLVVVVLVQKALQLSVPLEQIIRLIPFVMVETSPIAIPVTFLLAVTTFFAKMSGNNEIIALKSLGVAPWMFLWPVFVLGILMSLMTIWLNDLAVTWGRSGISAVIYGASEGILLNQLRTNHKFETPNKELAIMVKGVENKKLLSPVITLKNPPSTIEAKSALMTIDFSNRVLNISLANLKVDSGETKYFSDSRDITIPLETVISNNEGPKRPADMSLTELPAEISTHANVIASERRSQAARRAFTICCGNYEEWRTREETIAIGRKKNEQSIIERLRVEPQRRWSTGFSCLCFILLGAPLAIWMGKADVFSSFFACFIPILLFYYPLLMFGLQGAKNGTLPPESVWIANIVIALSGIWFWRKIHRF
ncbi:MAG: LptF/LptG family permease [Thermoguttaceae bacterium]